MNINSSKIGARGESTATTYLTQRGYKIVEVNYIAGRLGEIDIIALSPQNEITFVEVKTKTDNSRGSPLESITWGKRKKLLRSANYFLNSNTYRNKYATNGVKFLGIGVQISEANLII